jgi:hypothetical protein
MMSHTMSPLRIRSLLGGLARLALVTAVAAVGLIDEASAQRRPSLDPCESQYQGTLYARGGVPLTLLLSRDGRGGRGPAPGRPGPREGGVFPIPGGAPFPGGPGVFEDGGGIGGIIGSEGDFEPARERNERFNGVLRDPRGGSDQIRITIQSPRGQEVLPATCWVSHNGSAQIHVNGARGGQLNVTPSGQINGQLYGYQFSGYESGGRRPQPPPHPPGPPRHQDLCSGTIDGNSAGRWMSISIRQGWRDEVTVTVSHRHGSATVRGTCVYNRDGSASLTFAGPGAHGDLRIDWNGSTSGVVGGYGFSGHKSY